MYDELKGRKWILTQAEAAKVMERMCPICGGELLQKNQSHICPSCLRMFFLGPLMDPS